MKKDKIEKVRSYKELLREYECFYVVESRGMSADEDRIFRDECYNSNVVFKTVKNTLFLKALKEISSDEEEKKININDGIISEIKDNIKFISGLMFVKEGYKIPANIIYNLKRKGLPLKLKFALICDCLYIGDEKLQELKNLKTKNEIICGIVASLNSCVENVIGSLSDSGNKIYNIIDFLSKDVN